ncbi:hypothetical protein VZT92_018594 [Zoarces viviparus]|uniref:Uncharacterized protein n=1 Tax=Zoarces viviparus TaxID=48416 RepID=A0AAW1EIG0_ZOAVI
MRTLVCAVKTVRAIETPGIPRPPNGGRLGNLGGTHSSRPPKAVGSLDGGGLTLGSGAQFKEFDVPKIETLD